MEGTASAKVLGQKHKWHVWLAMEALYKIWYAKKYDVLVYYL